MDAGRAGLDAPAAADARVGVGGQRGRGRRVERRARRRCRDRIAPGCTNWSRRNSPARSVTADAGSMSERTAPPPPSGAPASDRQQVRADRRSGRGRPDPDPAAVVAPGEVDGGGRVDHHGRGRRSAAGPAAAAAASASRQQQRRVAPAGSRCAAGTSRTGRLTAARSGAHTAVRLRGRRRRSTAAHRRSDGGRAIGRDPGDDALGASAVAIRGVQRARPDRCPGRNRRWPSRPRWRRRPPAGRRGRGCSTRSAATGNRPGPPP